MSENENQRANPAADQDIEAQTEAQESAEAISAAGASVFIETPFINNLSDITRAQQLDESVDLGIDADLGDAWNEIDEENLEEGEGTDPLADLPSAEETDAEMSRIAESVAAQEQQIVAELEALAEQEEKAAAQRLAREIAEDEALEKQMKEEAERAAELDPELLAALPKEPIADENGNLDLAEMEACIETLLFMLDKPASAEKLQGLLGPEMSLSYFQEAIQNLQKRYQSVHHGFELVEVGGGFQFRTKPGRAALAKKLAKVQTQRLSTGAMETLAICAYKQPVLKEDIDKIRGVDSSHFVRGLLEKKLIRIVGRSEMVGRPMLYATTPEFLELFGLASLEAMPSLRELEQMVPASQTKNPEDEDPRVKEMRRLVGEMNTDQSVSLLYDPREDETFLKEIREKVQSIPTSSPYLDAQKEAEKQAKLIAEGKIPDPALLAAAAAELTAEGPAQGDLLAQPADSEAPASAEIPEIILPATPEGIEEPPVSETLS